MSDFTLASLLADPHSKTYFDGTQRACSPAETFEKYAPLMPHMGITRLADLTGLDRINLPVFQSVRPMARSLSVNQGKGVDPTAAKVSALMEAAETWHAENPICPLVHLAANDLPDTAERFDLTAMAAQDTPALKSAQDIEMVWLVGLNLMTGAAIHCPGDCVLMDYASPPDTDFLHRTSNGLASGNTRTEAVVAALLEVIERDCTADFMAAPQAKRRHCKLKASAVAAQLPKTITEGLSRAGTTVQVWDMTNDIGVPAYYAVLRGGKAPFSDQPLRGYAGAGCHLDPSVAVSRAVCEAIQSRLTVISGARDDLSARDFAPDTTAPLIQMTSLRFEAEQGIGMERVSRAGDTSSDDLAVLLGRLGHLGVQQVCAVDLTHPELELPVVRVVVPGLGHPMTDDGYKPSNRTRRTEVA